MEHRKKILIRLAGGAGALLALCCMIARLLPSVYYETIALAAAGFILPEGVHVSYTEEESNPVVSFQEEDAPEIVPSEETASSEAEKPATEPDPSRGSYEKIVETTLGGGKEYDGVHVKDATQNSGVTLSEELSKTPELNLQKGNVTVLLYHTHTNECYLESESLFYYADMESRSSDPEKSVVAVGEAVAKALRDAGINVIHDTNIYDTTYTGSYARSEAAVRKNLSEHPEIVITIDLHRDALQSAAGERLKPTVTVNGKKSAQIMIMTGCDPDGSLNFPNWEKNLTFALDLQKILETEHPGLMRPLYFCERDYNMAITPASLLVEVGTEVNTVSEASYAGSMFGAALAEEIRLLTE